jgi:hypothetical protein
MAMIALVEVSVTGRVCEFGAALPRVQATKRPHALKNSSSAND